MSTTILKAVTNVGPPNDASAITTQISGAWTYYTNAVVQMVCVNAALPPSRPCDANLQLSIDGVTWVTVDKRRFSQVPSITDYQIFRLSDYYGSSSDFAGGFGPPQQWLFFRVQIGGNQGSNCTVSAFAN